MASVVEAAASLSDSDFANTYCTICRREALDANTKRLKADQFCITSCYHVLCLSCFIGDPPQSPEDISACRKCVFFRPLDISLKEYEAAVEYQHANLEDQVQFLKKTCAQQRSVLAKQKMEIEGYAAQAGQVARLKDKVSQLETQLAAAQCMSAPAAFPPQPFRPVYKAPTFTSLGKRKAEVVAHPLRQRPSTPFDDAASLRTRGQATSEARPAAVKTHLQQFEYRSSPRKTNQLQPSPVATAYQLPLPNVSSSTTSIRRQQFDSSKINAPMPLPTHGFAKDQQARSKQSGRGLPGKSVSRAPSKGQHDFTYQVT